MLQGIHYAQDREYCEVLRMKKIQMKYFANAYKLSKEIQVASVKKNNRDSMRIQEEYVRSWNVLMIHINESEYD